MIDVYAVWCGPCKLMDRTTFSDPAVGDWARRSVIPVKIDAEKGEGGSSRSATWSRRSRPFSSSIRTGGEIDRLVAAYPPEPFLSEAGVVVAGTSPLQAALKALQKDWSPEIAAQAANVLAQRRDTARLRPLVVRYVTEEADANNPDMPLQLLTLLAALEDSGGIAGPRDRRPRRDLHVPRGERSAARRARHLPRAGAGPPRGDRRREEDRDVDARVARRRERRTPRSSGPSWATAEKKAGKERRRRRGVPPGLRARRGGERPAVGARGRSRWPSPKPSPPPGRPRRRRPP